MSPRHIYHKDFVDINTPPDATNFSSSTSAKPTAEQADEQRTIVLDVLRPRLLNEMRNIYYRVVCKCRTETSLKAHIKHDTQLQRDQSTFCSHVMTMLSHGLDIHTILSILDDVADYTESYKQIFKQWVLAAHLQSQLHQRNNPFSSSEDNATTFTADSPTGCTTATSHQIAPQSHFLYMLSVVSGVRIEAVKYIILRTRSAGGAQCSSVGQKLISYGGCMTHRRGHMFIMMRG